MANPNPYDDEAFVEASNAMTRGIASLAVALWKAGASVGDIANEIETGVQNAEDEIGTGRDSIMAPLADRL